jgi:hypothetical protein
MGITDSALIALLRKLKDEPITVDMSRWDTWSFLTDYFRKISCTLEVPLLDGSSMSWEVADVGKLLQRWVAMSQPFRNVMDSATSGMRGLHPEEPLNMILYLDGITPGNVLRPDNKRKIWAFYATFREIGPAHVCHEECWLPVAVLRTTVEHGLDGKLTSACAALAKHLLSIGRAGLWLKLATPAVVFWKFGNLLADEEGLNRFYGSKGASGIRPCFLCRNVVSFNCGVADGNEFIDCACTDRTKFVMNSDNDVWRTCDRVLASGALPRNELERLERATGLNRNPLSVMADVSLREHICPVSSYTFDWMHVWLSHGVMNSELAAFFQACRHRHRLKFADLDTFVQSGWRFPKLHTAGATVKDFFTETREKASADTFKCMASELLLIYPLIRQFAVTVVRRLGGLEHEVNSLVAACDAIDLMMAIKRSQGIARPEIAALRQALQRHGELHKRAYGSDWTRPKNHYAYHVPDQAERDGMLLDTFVLERKHQPIKASAQHIKNTQSFERSVLSRVLVSQERRVLEYSFGNTKMLGKVMTDQSLLGRAVVFSWRVRTTGSVTVSSGDVVATNGTYLEVRACAKMDDQFFLVGNELQVLEKQSTSACTCLRSARLSYTPVDSARHVHAWAIQSDGSYVVLS